MTAHQRRPGFRLPWSSEGDAGDPTAANDTPSSPSDTQTAAEAMPAVEESASDAASSADVTEPTPETTAETTEGSEVSSGDDAHAEAMNAEPTEPSPQPAPAAGRDAGQPPEGFLGDLLTAMRKVADDARQSTLAEVRARAEDVIRDREGGVERRREELRAAAETDIAGVGEWAKAEAERIRAEAERRVAARREELERQVAAEGTRHESSAASVRERVAAYERRLQTFHEQLGTISDPAEFAAAAKRMPPPPDLEAPDAIYQALPDPEPVAQPEPPAPSENGAEPATPVADASGADVPAAKLDTVDASAAQPPASETLAEPVATEIVVKGLGSFGAITGFRQQLAGVEGVDAVGLSLGASGEFVFRATHRPSLDMAAAITALEGEGVEIEPRAEGGLRVTLGRPR